jgi:SAM-dependent methyltransferase
MAQYDQVYQQAIYYDIALRRDVGGDVDFMMAAYRHYTGANPDSILDIACGPGYHARAFAQRGIRATGLDLRPEMLRFAQDQALAAGLQVTWLAADMRLFQLERPVDMAMCVFDGVDALLTNDDVIQHLRTVAANLTPNGLYLLEQTHPRYSSFQDYGQFRYAGQQNGTGVEILWATNHPSFDPVTGVAQVEIEMRVSENGDLKIIRDPAQERLLTPQEIRLLAERSGGLRPVGWWGDFDLNQPLDNSPASSRMVTLLQKVG